MKQFITGIAMFFLCGLFVGAQDPSGFNPNNPPEPTSVFALTLDSDPAQVGVVTGGGNYHTGDRVLITATSNGPYVFVAWMEGTTVVSNTSDFYFTIPDRNVRLTAHFEYRLMYQLTLVTDPAGVGTVQGSGHYQSGSSASLSTDNPSGYSFKGWWENDTLLNEQSTFQYLMPNRSVQLTAKFEYTPSNPSEPIKQGEKHAITMISQPPNGGYFSPESGLQIREGESANLTAYRNTGFLFDGWFRNDSLCTTATTLNYTMDKVDATFVARFHYDPSAPVDPNPGTNPVYSLIAISRTAAAGSYLAYPVYLSNENTAIYSATFEMTFPAGVLVDYPNVVLSSRSNGHILAIDTLGNNSFRFTVINGESMPLSGSSGILLTIPVTLPMDWVAGSSYPVIFSNAAIGKTTGLSSCPVKNGTIGVTATTSNLYAGFYSDIHLNRALFTNMSSTDARTFQWSFGDGQSSTEKNPLHVYSGTGSYEVVLNVSDGVNKDTVRTTIRIEDTDLWSLEGYYTLNQQGKNVKNFSSLMALFSTFSLCTIPGNVVIQVAPGQLFDIPMDSMVNVIFLRLASKIQREGGPTLTFVSDVPDSIPLLNFTGSLHRPYMETILGTAKNFRFENVETAFSGLKIQTDQLHALSDLTICSGHATPEINLSVIGNQFDMDWQLSKPPLYLSGQPTAGTMLIPSMIPWNDTTFTDTLIYTIRFVSNSYVFYSRELRYDVRAAIQVAPTALTPINNEVLESPNVTFRWNAQENALYDLFLWRNGTSMPTLPLVSGLWTGSYTDDRNCVYGNSYQWRILARSSCDSIWSAVDSFQIGRLPDLQVESITFLNKEYFAGDAMEVQTRIHNRGGKAYRRTWTDQLYLVYGNNQQYSLSASTQSGLRELEPDSSYQVLFQVILPLDTTNYTHFMVKTDTWNNLPEVSELNNTMLSDSLHLKHNTIEDAEFNALRLLYDRTAGVHWVHHWDFTTNKILATNWSGIGFEKGHVVSIDLNHNNLNGQLPAELFNLPYLRTLNLNNNKLSGRLEVLADSMEARNYQCDSLLWLNLGYNLLSGEISSFANRFPNLDYLDLESNQFSEIDAVLSRHISNLNLQNQTFSHPDIPLAMNPVLEIPSLFWYKHESSELRRLDPGFSLYMYKDNTYMGSIYYTNQSTFVLSLYRDWNAPSGDTVELRQYNNYLYGSKTKLHFTFQMGDANIDQKTDILDVQHTLNRIFAEDTYPFNRYAANTYPDDKITVQDIVSTVNILLESGVVQDTTQLFGLRETSVEQPNNLRSASVDNVLYIVDGALMLNVQAPVSALDLSLRNVRDKQLRMLLNSNDFQLIARNTSDGVRFIIYSGSRKEIPAGLTSLAQLSSENAEIVRASLANKQAETVPVLIVNNWTDLPNSVQPTIQAYLNQHSITLLLNSMVEQVTAQVYNMQGMLINKQEMNQLSIGSHTIEYSNTLHAGAYLLKLVFRNGNSVQTKNYKWIVSK